MIRVLIIHQNLPGQLRRLIQRLGSRRTTSLRAPEGGARLHRTQGGLAAAFVFISISDHIHV